MNPNREPQILPNSSETEMSVEDRGLEIEPFTLPEKTEPGMGEARKRYLSIER